jgi:hypothetical protein
MEASEVSMSTENTRPNPSKPIKKRVSDNSEEDEDFEDVDDSPKSSPNSRFSSGNGNGDSLAKGNEISVSEAKAKKELSDFLEHKGVDVARELNGYKVHVQAQKSRRSAPGSFTVTYTGPDGDILTSKTDVLNAIKAGSVMVRALIRVRITVRVCVVIRVRINCV